MHHGSLEYTWYLIDYERQESETVWPNFERYTENNSGVVMDALEDDVGIVDYRLGEYFRK